MKAFADPVSRALVALIFILSGFGKLAGYAGTKQMMVGVGFPAVDLFLVGAIASYLSIRLEAGSDRMVRLERCADICFVLGLVSLTLIAVLFAYETI